MKSRTGRPLKIPRKDINKVLNQQKMKRNIISVFASIALVPMLFQSCLKDNDNNTWQYIYPNATVTVKPAGDSFYMQLDENTTMVATNMDKAPFGGKEIRALLNFTEEEAPHDGYDKAVKVNWIDSILTKKTVPAPLEGEKDEYGNDPVEIYNDWITYVEDGYITLHFTTVWGSNNVKHGVNLVTGTNPDNPYEVVFRHNAFGDTCGTRRDGIVAFRLDQLPDTEGKTVKITLKWNSFSGEKSTTFDYRTRKDD